MATSTYHHKVLSDLEKQLSDIKSREDKIADGYKKYSKEMQATNEFFRHLTEKVVLYINYMKLLSSAKIHSAQREIILKKIEEIVPDVKDYITYMNNGGD